MDIFFPRRRLWITSALLLAASLGCKRRGPAAADPDEELVAAFVEPARIAELYGADCELWAQEAIRLASTDRMVRLNERLRLQTDAQHAAFHAKYGSRIDPLEKLVGNTVARCVEEASKGITPPPRFPAPGELP